MPQKYSFVKIYRLVFTCLAFAALQVSASAAGSFSLMMAPGTVSDKSATALWTKQTEQPNALYEIMLNGRLAATTAKTNFTFGNLKPNTIYKVTVRLKTASPTASINTISFTTRMLSKMFNVVDYGAKGDSTTLNTKAIQAAIDACTPGGTVYIPKGIFVTGALFLKSDMTLYIEKDAVLKGSAALADYLPMIRNRFEGWELDTYASLLNAGKLNRDGSYNVNNLRISGEGTLMSGGRRMGDAMIKANGIRSRGRLICLMNCHNVDISGITLTQPPSWTLHYIYSDNISCHDLNIATVGVPNGDGIDPDSSTNSYIFNCTFNTGDDCIAIKSGKNPEGFIVAKPTTNVRVTDCDFQRGHGISIGSEMSGGVSDVLVQDCKAGALLHGLQIKGTKERGGYVKNVTVTDCQLLQITVFSALNYNNDGEGAPHAPMFENFTFKNIDLSAAPLKEPVIDINGFKETGHRLRNVTFTNVKLPDNAKVNIKDAEQVKFINTKTTSGGAPQYVVADSDNIVY